VFGNGELVTGSDFDPLFDGEQSAQKATIMKIPMETILVRGQQ
jgi:hypothetical protein